MLSLNAEMVLGGYMILCVTMLVFVYLLPAFDMRSLLIWDDRKDWDNHLRVDVFERPDLAAIFAILTLMAVGFAAWLGWRAPIEIERWFGGGARGSLLFPDASLSRFGRLAQVIGMLSLALIALRSLRPFVFLATVATVALLALIAVGYVLGGL